MLDNPCFDTNQDPSLYQVTHIDDQIIVARLPDLEKGETFAKPVLGISKDALSLHAQYSDTQTIVRLSTGETLIIPTDYPDFVAILASIETLIYGPPPQTYEMEDEFGELAADHIDEEDLPDLERAEFLKKEGKLN